MMSSSSNEIGEYINALKVNLRSITEYANFNSSTLFNALSDYWYEDRIIRRGYINYNVDAYEYVNEIIASYEKLIFVGCKELDQIYRTCELNWDKEVVLVSDRELEIDHGKYKNLKYIYSNLNFYSQTEIVYRCVKNNKRNLVVLIDILEHLVDPLPVLRLVKNLLRLNSYSSAVITTFDREDKYNDIPINKSHVREWSKTEFIGFIKSIGFNIKEIYKVRSNDLYGKVDSILVHCDVANYDNFIKEQFKTSIDKVYFLVKANTNEFKISDRDLLLEKLLSLSYENNGQVVLIEDSSDNSRLCIDNGILHPSIFFDDETIKSLASKDLRIYVGGNRLSYLAYQTIYYLNYFFDIKVLCFEDLRGLGFRTIQAKKANLIQEEINILIDVSGNLLYRAHQKEKLLEFDDLLISYTEKYTLENADIVIFPSSYMKSVYEKFDICSVQRNYVFYDKCHVDLSETDLVDLNFDELWRLVFVGYVNQDKSFDVFLEALSKLAELNIIGLDNKINTIEIYAPDLNELTSERLRKLNNLQDKLEIKQEHLTEKDFIYKLNEIRKDSLIIFLGNDEPIQSLAIDAILLKSHLILNVTGFFEEIVPVEMHADVLFKLNSEDLKEKIIHNLNFSISKKVQLVSNLYEFIKNKITTDERKKNELINQLLLEYDDNTYIKSYRFSGENDITVIMPVYNTNLGQFEKAIYSLNIQTKQPSHVIIVDDGSDDNYHIRLAEVLANVARFKYTLLKQECNKGQAAARNYALKYVDTKYVTNLDSDDCVHPEYINLVYNYLEKNNELVSCCCFILYFDEEEDPHKIKVNINQKGYFHPILQVYSLAYLGNFESFAHNAYVTKIVKEVGGWDETDRAGAEDRALGLKTIVKGYKIGIVPMHLFYYRIRPNSSYRTKSKYLANLNVARANILMPFYESYIQLCKDTGISKFIDEISRLNLKKQSLEKNIYDLNQHMHELNNKIHNLSLNLSQLNNQNTELNLTLNRLQNELNFLEVQNNTLNQQIAELTQQNSELQRNLDSARVYCNGVYLHSISFRVFSKFYRGIHKIKPLVFVYRFIKRFVKGQSKSSN